MCFLFFVFITCVLVFSYNVSVAQSYFGGYYKVVFVLIFPRWLHLCSKLLSCLHYPLLIAIQTSLRLQIFLKNWKSIYGSILQWEEPRHREIKSSVLGRKPLTEYLLFVCFFFRPPLYSRYFLDIFFFLILAGVWFFFSLCLVYWGACIFNYSSLQAISYEETFPCLHKAPEETSSRTRMKRTFRYFCIFYVLWIRLCLALPILRSTSNPSPIPCHRLSIFFLSLSPLFPPAGHKGTRIWNTKQ